MTRHLLPLTILFVALLATAAAISADESADSDMPVIDATSAATTRYEPIPFAAHDYHGSDLEIGCVECHHTTGPGDALPTPCSVCHDRSGAKVNLEAAAHGSCRACHAAFKKSNPDSSAPTECLGCHQERK